MKGIDYLYVVHVGTVRNSFFREVFEVNVELKIIFYLIPHRSRLKFFIFGHLHLQYFIAVQELGNLTAISAGKECSLPF